MYLTWKCADKLVRMVNEILFSAEIAAQLFVSQDDSKQ